MEYEKLEYNIATSFLHFRGLWLRGYFSACVQKENPGVQNIYFYSVTGGFKGKLYRQTLSFLNKVVVVVFVFFPSERLGMRRRYSALSATSTIYFSFPVYFSDRELNT